VLFLCGCLIFLSLPCLDFVARLLSRAGQQSVFLLSRFFWLSQKKCQGAAQRSASWPFLVLGSSDSVSCSQEHAAWHFFASVRGRAPACKGSWISECAKIFISSFRFPVRAGAALSLICVLLSLVVGAGFSCSIYERARPCGFSFPRCKPRAGGQSSFP
jgi:hypothetical protein